MFSVGSIGAIGRGVSRRRLWTPFVFKASLLLYLDSADFNTVTLNTDTLNGTKITQLSDKSTYARHVTQAAEASQPTLDVASLNGTSTVLLDGVDDFFSVPEFNTARTVAIVGKGGTATKPHLSGAAPNLFTPTWNVSNARVEYRARADTTVRSVLLGGLSTEWNIAVFTINPTLNEISIYSTTQATFSQTIGPNDALINTIGRDYAGAGQFSDSSIAAVVAIDYVLPLADVQRLHAFLAWEKGLVSGLPSDNPYRSARPTA